MFCFKLGAIFELWSIFFFRFIFLFKAFLRPFWLVTHDWMFLMWSRTCSFSAVLSLNKQALKEREAAFFNGRKQVETKSILHCVGKDNN